MDEVVDTELIFLLTLDNILNEPVVVQHLEFPRTEGSFKHLEQFSHHADMVGDDDNEVVLVLVRNVFLLRDAEMEEVGGVEKDHHSGRNLAAHAHLDV